MKGIDLGDDGTDAYRQKQDYIFKYGLDGLGVSWCLMANALL